MKLLNFNLPKIKIRVIYCFTIFLKRAKQIIIHEINERITPVGALYWISKIKWSRSFHIIIMKAYLIFFEAAGVLNHYKKY